LEKIKYKMKRESVSKEGVLILCSVIAILLFSSFVSAGFFEWFNKLTGRATSGTVDINISVGVPQIIRVDNTTIDLSNGPNEYPLYTSIIINFSVYSPSSVSMLNYTSARINVTDRTTARYNISCINWYAAGDYANFTCNVTLFHWDASGQWNITVSIKDNNSNMVQNMTTTFYVGTRTAVKMAPAILTWAGIASGAVNQTSNNDPILMNNTGNDVIDIGGVTVNATDLRGERNDTLALWGGNFTVSTVTGNPTLECNETTMGPESVYTAVARANLSIGNFTANNGDVGQEQLYVCLKLAGTELTTQPYSTVNESSWTIKIA
jgi:hypothetical protein